MLFFNSLLSAAAESIKPEVMLLPFGHARPCLFKRQDFQYGCYQPFH